MGESTVDLKELLFPGVADVAIASVEAEPGVIRVAARSTARGARCPGCRGWSERVHGSYQRHPAHLPTAGKAVVLVLTVRRFLCGDRECPRQTFAEQVSGLTRPYAHRTERQRSTLARIALALAGRAGARLAHRLGMTAGRDTLLRLIRALPDPNKPTPRVLGVDDFAFRKGHTYGTILIDIGTHRPIDVLPDREAATLARWLADRPGVEVICRDRSTAYADGARAGAPDAEHCADRWHLFHNLVEAVEKTVVRHRALLPEPELPDGQPALTAEDVRAAASTARTTAAPRTSGRISDRTRERHQAIHELHRQGHSLRGIAAQLGLARNTIRRFLRTATADDLLVGKWTGRTSILDPHKPYLHQRWAEGCTTARRLFEELRDRGYTGGESVIKEYVRQLRDAFPRTDRPPRRHPSVRDVTSWITRHPDNIADHQAERLKAILGRCPELEKTAHHVRTFAELMTRRHGDQLEEWMSKVQADDLPDLHSFVAGLRQDAQAVTNGLTLPYSSGPVEGAVNRIKMLKRQMFGRAKLPLLRKRILLS
ncbi:ISL3 family transposase [Streptomyces sp. LZ34]